VTNPLTCFKNMFSLPSNIILGNGTILIISYTKSKEPNKQIAPNGYINTGVGFEIYRWDIKNKRSIESTVCGKMDTNNFHIAIIHHVNEEQSVKSFLREKLNADKWTTDERELTQHHDRKKWRDHLLKSNTGISVESDFSYSKWHAKRDIEISNPRFSHGEKQDCLGMLVGMIVVIVLIFLGNLIVREIIEESIHATETAIASTAEPATPTPTQKLNENKECIDDVETKFLKARGYHYNKQFEEANELYKIIVGECKTHVNAYIGLYKIEKVLYNEGISVLSYGIYNNPESAELRYYLGEAHYDKKEYYDAIDAYNQAIDRNEKYTVAHFKKGESYFKLAEQCKNDKNCNEKKLYEMAINAYEKVVSIDSTYKAYDKLGYAYSRIGDTDAANKYWRKVVEK